MPKKKSKPQKVKINQDTNTNLSSDKVQYAFIATILSIIGFIIVILVKRNDKYVMYYAKQSLVIFIIGAVGGALGALFSIIPIIGAIINFGIFIIVLLAWLLSWIHALSGEEKPLLIISDIAKNFNF